MSEIIEADNCAECQLRDESTNGDHWCSFGGMRIEDTGSIPFWCPLNDPVLSAAYGVKRVGKPVKKEPGLDELREMAEKMGYKIERITA